jgi:hypothetical protein
MKYVFIIALVYVFFTTSSSQTVNNLEPAKLIKVWGEVSKSIPAHRGKAGLVLLELQNNNSFKAYENTDYGASILQIGKWKLKGKNIIFTVINTILARQEKEYFMRGRILELEKGEVSYEILVLDESKFVMRQIGGNKTLKFEQSKYVYFPKA